VNPDKEFVLLIFFEPGQGLPDCVFRPTLNFSQRDFFETAKVEAIEIIVKTLIEAPFGINYIGRNKSSCLVAGRLKALSQSLKFVRDDKAAIVSYSMVDG